MCALGGRAVATGRRMSIALVRPFPDRSDGLPHSYVVSAWAEESMMVVVVGSKGKFKTKREP